MCHLYGLLFLILDPVPCKSIESDNIVFWHQHCAAYLPSYPSHLSLHLYQGVPITSLTTNRFDFLPSYGPKKFKWALTEGVRRILCKGSLATIFIHYYVIRFTSYIILSLANPVPTNSILLLCPPHNSYHARSTQYTLVSFQYKGIRLYSGITVRKRVEEDRILTSSNVACPQLEHHFA